MFGKTVRSPATPTGTPHASRFAPSWPFQHTTVGAELVTCSPSTMIRLPTTTQIHPTADVSMRFSLTSGKKCSITPSRKVSPNTTRTLPTAIPIGGPPLFSTAADTPILRETLERVQRSSGRLSTSGGGWTYGRWQSKRGMWSHMRSLLSRFSDWVVVHPVLWGVGSGVVLVLLGFALNLAPIVVLAAGAAIGVLNVLHARRRGYCPLPA